MNASAKCPKCNGEMQEGFILDAKHDARFRVSSWVAGKPEKSFWEGTKVDGKEQHHIQSFRCTCCGYLESYARET
jgi:hypothetical protein